MTEPVTIRHNPDRWTINHHQADPKGGKKMSGVDFERATGAIRGQLRHIGIPPKEATARQIEETMDELTRLGHEAVKKFQRCGARTFKNIMEAVKK